MPPSCALLDGFAVDALVVLLWQHCGNAWQSPAVIRQAHRTPHALRMRRRLTPLADDNIAAPAACAVLFRPCCRGVVTRTRNVSDYTLVLALCLVDSQCPAAWFIAPPCTITPTTTTKPTTTTTTTNTTPPPPPPPLSLLLNGVVFTCQMPLLSPSQQWSK